MHTQTLIWKTLNPLVSALLMVLTHDTGVLGGWLIVGHHAPLIARLCIHSILSGALARLGDLMAPSRNNSMIST